MSEEKKKEGILVYKDKGLSWGWYLHTSKIKKDLKPLHLVLLILNLRSSYKLHKTGRLIFYLRAYFSVCSEDFIKKWKANKPLEDNPYFLQMVSLLQMEGLQFLYDGDGSEETNRFVVLQ